MLIRVLVIVAIGLGSGGLAVEAFESGSYGVLAVSLAIFVACILVLLVYLASKAGIITYLDEGGDQPT